MKSKKKEKIKKNKIGIIITSAISAIIILSVLLFLLFYFNNKKLTVSFDVDNKEYYEISDVKKGSIIEKPQDPTKEGYTFIGWFINDKEFNFDEPITENVKLESKWSINKYKVTIKTFFGNETEKTVEHNSIISKPEDPKKTGYIFAGWYSEGKLFDFNTKITKDYVIEAKWTTQVYANYTVEYYLMDKEGNYSIKPTSVEVFSGKINSTVTPNVKEFTGYTSPEASSIKVSVYGDSKVKYYYSINKYNLTIETDSGIEEISGSGTYFYNDKIKLDYVLKPGYVIDSFSEVVEEDIYTMLDKDVTIVISTKPSDNTKYTIEHYKMNLNGTYDSDASEVEILYGTTDTIVTTSCKTYVGFTSPITEEVLITGDGNAVVKYYYERNKYELSLIAGSGITTVIGSGQYYYGTEVEISAVFKDGYKFTGWSNGSDSSTLVYTVSNNDDVLTATAEIIDYKINYILNGGTVTGNNPNNYTVETDTITLINPVKHGYTFKEWKLNDTTNDGTITQGTTGDITLEAIFEANIYSIVFDANGGIGTMPTLLTAYDINTTLTENAFTKEGYTFIGWSTSSDGNVSYTNQEIVSNLTDEDNGSITLYAVWQQNNYTIKFDANTGVGTISDLQAIYNEEITLTKNTFAKTGYTFVGWNTSKDADNALYSDEEKVINLVSNKNEVITLYAIWEANTYSIEFDANSGAGTMTLVPVVYDEKTTLPKSTFVKEGYTFIGWNTSKDANNALYNDEEEVQNLTAQDNEQVTLYAIWRANNYSIKFDANTGVGAIADLVISYDVETQLFKNTFVKDGYTFIGWNTNKDANNALYSDEEKVKNLINEDNGSIVLYAIWEANTYTVEFNSNGGTGTMNNVLATYDELFNLPSNTFVKASYSFLGWSIDNNDTVEYVDMQLVSNLTKEDNGKITLYAVWQEDSYVVKFNANTGIGTMTDLLVPFDKVINLPTNIFTKEGYTFIGWNTSKDANVALYLDEASVQNLVSEKDGQITLFAIWSKNNYTISFDANTGKGTMSNIPVNYDEEITLPTNVFAKEGYEFNSWNTKKDGTGVTYYNQEVVSNLVSENNGNITLYAIWDANIYTIQFFANGGEGTMASLLTAYDNPTKLTKNQFTKEGYSFVEWNTEINGNGKAYSDEEEVINLVKENDENFVLYAIWEINKYTVTFDTDGGTSIAPIIDNYGTKIDMPNDPTKIGHKFLGWYINKELTEEFDFTSATIPNRDVVIYAKWKVNSSTIAFDTNGGSPITAITKNYGEVVTAPADSVKEGYTFAGWYSDKGLLNEYVFTTMPSKGITVYAKWIPNNYTIKFNSNGGVGIKEDINTNYDETIVLKNPFTKEGYTFNSWNTKEDGTGTKYSNNESVTKLITSGDITLYAIWEANSYKVIFNSNDGEGTMSSQELKYGVSSNLNTVIFTKEGHTFNSWNTKIDGTGVKYLNNENVINMTTKESITLYAIWDVNTYTVKFDSNGGVGTMSNLVATYNQEFQLTKNAFTKEGYTFVGWSIDNNLESIEYEDSEIIKNLVNEHNGSITLYAVWQVNTYTIEFDSNGGSGTMPNILTAYDKDTTLLDNKFTKTGYVFLGWSIDKNDTKAKYQNLETVKNLTTTPNGKITLYAIWGGKNYTIIFNSNSGIGTMLNLDTTYEKNIQLSANLFTKEGYTFDSWNTKANGSGTKYLDKQEVSKLTLEKEITLYAIWQENSYTVKFDGNTGDGQMQDALVTYSEEITLTNSFVKEGYTFDSFNTKSDGTGIKYLPNQKVAKLVSTNSGIITLYAIWQENSYTIKFDNNTGDGQMPDELVMYNEKITLTNGFVKEGYTFTNWNTKADGTGITYSSTEQVNKLVNKNNGNITLYAIWQENNYTINFNSNGGSGNMTSVIASYNESINLPENKFIRDGYKFNSFNTKADGTGT